MKFRSLLIALIFLLFFSPIIYAKEEQNHPMLSLNQIADDALQMTKQERYAEAKQLLEHFSEKFMEVDHKQVGADISDIRVVTATHSQALGALTAVDLPHDERISSVTKFRLAIDALYSSTQPLWIELEDSVMSSFQELKASATKGDTNEYKHRLNLFLSKYGVIQPAISIDKPVEQVQMLDSFIAFLETSRLSTITEEERLRQFEALERELTQLFSSNNQQDEADPSLIWVMISVGSVILVTLFYAGWQKYRGEKEQTKQKERQR